MKVAAAVLIVAAFALSIGFYVHLPATVPVHWNAEGAINGYASRSFGAFVMPVVMLALAGVFAALPAVSPKGFGIERKSRAYGGIVFSILLFLFGVHVFMLLAALRVVHSITAVIPLLLGPMLITLGNYLPKMRRNFFVGIRTPWTLADEDVWYRTHRLGGVLFVICGALLMAIGPFLRARAMEAFILSMVIGAALIAAVYSFVIYRRNGDGPDQGEASP
jgi:uncharacterized membrane protein